MRTSTSVTLTLSNSRTSTKAAPGAPAPMALVTVRLPGRLAAAVSALQSLCCRRTSGWRLAWSEPNCNAPGSPPTQPRLAHTFPVCELQNDSVLLLGLGQRPPWYRTCSPKETRRTHPSPHPPSSFSLLLSLSNDPGTLTSGMGMAPISQKASHRAGAKSLCRTTEGLGGSVEGLVALVAG